MRGPSARVSGEPLPTRERGVSEEGALLKRAAEALRAGDMKNARDILEDHAQAFPTSPLSDLRSALHIEVLCALGNVAQARGEAAGFRKAHSASPFRRRVDNSCIRG